MVFKTVSGGASGFYKQGPVEPEELGSTNFHRLVGAIFWN